MTPGQNSIPATTRVRKNSRRGSRNPDAGKLSAPSPVSNGKTKEYLKSNRPQSRKTSIRNPATTKTQVPRGKDESKEVSSRAKTSTPTTNATTTATATATTADTTAATTVASKSGKSNSARESTSPSAVDTRRVTIHTDLRYTANTGKMASHRHQQHLMKQRKQLQWRDRVWNGAPREPIDRAALISEGLESRVPASGFGRYVDNLGERELDAMRHEICESTFMNASLNTQPTNKPGDSRRFMDAAKAELQKSKKIAEEKEALKKVGVLTPMPPQLSKFRVKEVILEKVCDGMTSEDNLMFDYATANSLQPALATQDSSINEELVSAVVSTVAQTAPPGNSSGKTPGKTPAAKTPAGKTPVNKANRNRKNNTTVAKQTATKKNANKNTTKSKPKTAKNGSTKNSSGSQLKNANNGSDVTTITPNPKVTSTPTTSQTGDIKVTTCRNCLLTIDDREEELASAQYARNASTATHASPLRHYDTPPRQYAATTTRPLRETYPYAVHEDATYSDPTQLPLAYRDTPRGYYDPGLGPRHTHPTGNDTHAALYEDDDQGVPLLPHYAQPPDNLGGLLRHQHPSQRHAPRPTSALGRCPPRDYREAAITAARPLSPRPPYPEHKDHVTNNQHIWYAPSRQSPDIQDTARKFKEDTSATRYTPPGGGAVAGGSVLATPIYKDTPPQWQISPAANLLDPENSNGGQIVDAEGRAIDSDPRQPYLETAYVQSHAHRQPREAPPLSGETPPLREPTTYNREDPALAGDLNNSERRVQAQVKPGGADSRQTTPPLRRDDTPPLRSEATPTLRSKDNPEPIAETTGVDPNWFAYKLVCQPNNEPMFVRINMKEEAMKAMNLSHKTVTCQSTPATKISTISTENDDRQPKSILSQSRKHKDFQKLQQPTQSTLLDANSMDESVIYFSDATADRGVSIRHRGLSNATHATPSSSRKEMPPMQVSYSPQRIELPACELVPSVPSSFEMMLTESAGVPRSNPNLEVQANPNLPRPCLKDRTGNGQCGHVISGTSEYLDFAGASCPLTNDSLLSARRRFASLEEGKQTTSGGGGAGGGGSGGSKRRSSSLQYTHTSGSGCQRPQSRRHLPVAVSSRASNRNLATGIRRQSEPTTAAAVTSAQRPLSTILSKGKLSSSSSPCCRSRFSRRSISQGRCSGGALSKVTAYPSPSLQTLDIQPMTCTSILTSVHQASVRAKDSLSALHYVSSTCEKDFGNDVASIRRRSKFDDFPIVASSSRSAIQYMKSLSVKSLLSSQVDENGNTKNTSQIMVCKVCNENITEIYPGLEEDICDYCFKVNNSSGSYSSVCFSRLPPQQLYADQTGTCQPLKMNQQIQVLEHSDHDHVLFDKPDGKTVTIVDSRRHTGNAVAANRSLDDNQDKRSCIMERGI